MGKKQRDYREDDGSSTESHDEAKNTAKMNGGEVCNHIKKAQLDLAAVRKRIKPSGFAKVCSSCSKPDDTETTSNGLAEAGDSTRSLWLCLKCGTQLCGRFEKKHALEHAASGHSLAIETTMLEVWCYECNAQVDPKAKPKLLECVEFVQRQATKQLNSSDPLEDDARLQMTTDAVGKMVLNVLKTTPLLMDGTDRLNFGSTNRAPTNRSTSGGVITISSPSDMGMRSYGMDSKPFTVESLPRVRGLSNLGNTCFFNAVLQCLARTPYLLPIMKQSAVEGGKVVIHGGMLKLPDGEELELPAIKGELGAWRKLTRSLADVLTQLTDSSAGVITPKQLLAELGSKLPQFAGREQHDSHELLRQLLESVRTEDQKRYEELILPALGVERRRTDKTLDETMKAKVRFYGDQISQQVLRPEQIFRGSLVSTLTCQDCRETSSRHEYFLDISLPVCVDKPQPPGTGGAGGKTKASGKKERAREKKAKRMAKHQKNRKNLSSSVGAVGEVDGDAPGPDEKGTEGKVASRVIPDDATDGAAGDAVDEDNDSSDDSNEPSDADVEDNDVTDDAPSKERGEAELADDQTGAQQAGPEKVDDTPENQDKEGTGGARMARQRTISHADWSNPIAPRYQCEDGEYSVQSCFNNFTTVELMTGNNKVCCDVCTETINGKDGKSVNTNATKQFLISVPPAVLILHLKRFQVGARGFFKKITKSVSFPFVLDIAPFCGSKVKRAAHVRPGQKKILYALYGLVEHSGSMHAGHYVAYVKVRPPIAEDDLRWKFIPTGSKDELDRKTEQEMAKEQARWMMDDVQARRDAAAENNENETEPAEPSAPEADEEEGAIGLGAGAPAEKAPEPVPDVKPPPGKWYYVSDSHVREASEDSVLQSQAYLLFYERIF